MERATTNTENDVWRFLAYLNQYESEGIKFQIWLDKSFDVTAEVAKKNNELLVAETEKYRGQFIQQYGEDHFNSMLAQDNSFFDSYVGTRQIRYEINQEVENEVVKRFCIRRWRAEEQLFTELRFLNRELAYLNGLDETVKEEFKFQFYPILKYLDIALANGFISENSTVKEIDRRKLIKTKLDFTRSKLEGIVLDLASLNGYEKPSTYLDELLEDVIKFDSVEFEGDFFLNIHYLCQEHADKFWSESHRKDITKWLSKARIVTDVFENTWRNSVPQRTIANTATEEETFVPRIHEFLDVFRDKMTLTHYNNFVTAIDKYFVSGHFPKVTQISIQRVNKKELGWALSRIFVAIKPEVLSLDYLKFFKENTNTFSKVDFDNNRSSNLYRYFTTKPKKK